MKNSNLNGEEWDYERPVEGSSHLEAVMRWLDENQIHLDQPNSVTVKDFVVETEDHASFTLILDDKPYPERFECDTSLVEFDPLRLPIYCSPLGAPASYPVYDLTTATYCAVNNALRQANKLLNKAGVNVSDIAVTVDLNQYKDF